MINFKAQSKGEEEEEWEEEEQHPDLSYQRRYLQYVFSSRNVINKLAQHHGVSLWDVSNVFHLTICLSLDQDSAFSSAVYYKLSLGANCEPTGKRIVVDENLRHGLLDDFNCCLISFVLWFEAVDGLNYDSNVLVQVREVVEALLCFLCWRDQFWLSLIDAKFKSLFELCNLNTHKKKNAIPSSHHVG